MKQPDAHQGGTRTYYVWGGGGVAAEALAHLGDKRAVPQLINSLRDHAPEVRFWSAYALGGIGDKRAVTHLEELAKTDNATLAEWGRISDEALQAIKSIRRQVR